jgi:hypothetical protein
MRGAQVEAFVPRCEQPMCDQRRDLTARASSHVTSTDQSLTVPRQTRHGCGLQSTDSRYDTVHMTEPLDHKRRHRGVLAHG